MKCFCLIILILLLLAPWQPCQDLAAENVTCSLAAEQTTLHNDPKSDEEKDCSEICGCSGYESATDEVNSRFSFDNKFIVLTETSFENSYQDQYSQTHSSSIWQPPKINHTV